MKHLILFILMSGLGCSVVAKGNEVGDARLLGQFSFTKYLGGIILIRAKLDGRTDTLNFIMDTGSGGISLDSTTCERLQLENRLTDTFVSGVGGKRKVRFTFNRTLKMGDLTFDSLNFHINDYSAMTSINGLKIDGILGYSFLKKFIVTVDYEQLLMKVYTAGKMEYPKNGYVLKIKMNPIPNQKVAITDGNQSVEGNLFFDSGAKMELVLSKRFVSESHVFSKKRSFRSIGVEGVSGKERMKVSVVKELAIGPYKFKNVPAYIYDDINNVTNYPYNFGLVGSGIFGKFNQILNFPEEEIFLKPNAFYAEPFDYSYTGMVLYEDAGKFLVYDVFPQSPAETSGLLPEDEIISVDTHNFNDLQTCRNAIAKTNSYVLLLIKRGVDYKYVLLKTSSII